MEDYDFDNDLAETFNKAVDYITLTNSKQPQDKLLELYGYYKQALEGPCTNPKPQWLEFKAKAKWEAWSRLKDMDQETAMKQYVKTVSKLDPSWLETSNSKDKSWLVKVSCMSNTEECIADVDKTIFDWVKEGHVEKVRELACRSNSSLVINSHDSVGLAPIHWAADRGNLIMVQCLVMDLKANINLKDSDGQTALHFASSCGHIDVLQFLLKNGADPQIADEEGNLPVDIAADETVRAIIVSIS